MMGLLVKRTYFSSGELVLGPPPSPEKGESSKEEWMGIYYKDSKVGYARTWIVRENGGYRISDDLFLQLMMLGSHKKVSARTHSLVDEDFSLKSFDFRLTSGITTFKVTGKIVGKILKLSINTGGVTKEEGIQIQGVPYLVNSIPSLISRGGIEEGKRYSLPIFDPLTLSQKKIIVEVEDREKIEIGDKMISSHRIRVSFNGVPIYLWVDDRGERLKEGGFGGLTLIREDRERALKENWEKETPVDLIDVNKITPRKKITGKDRLNFLTLRLQNIPLNRFIVNDQRQNIDNDILEVRREDIEGLKSFPLPYREVDKEKYLSPSPFIQSKDPELIKTAKTILKDERDAVLAVTIILNWIYKNVEKKPILSIPSALEVLKNMTGDCNEHAVLFTALCRAAGIPSRICAGIVYLEGSFYYHAWSEVYLNQWVSVDPTLNQFPADVTHIKLVEGGLEYQQELMGIIGKLKLEILEYR